MRKAYSDQMRFDCKTVANVQLNLNCRDEIIPVLFALQHIYGQTDRRDEILDLVAQDVNEDSRDDCGRKGLGYWCITVLAAVRLGCNLDYDKLQDLAENHRTLCQIMGIGDWQNDIDFSARRIRDNICLLKPETIEKISHLIVGAGHQLEPHAVEKVRADSFVVETNIHYPTESSLIFDGLRKIIQLCVTLSAAYNMEGWRQHTYLLKTVKQIVRQIGRTNARKGTGYQKRNAQQYRSLLSRAEAIIARALQTCETRQDKCELDTAAVAQTTEIKLFIERTQHVCDTARRRVLEGETVPNEDKLFSIFETHTQLYKRGKAGEPVQFGRLALVYEDAAGYIVHHHLMARDACDSEVAVAQTQTMQQRLEGRVKSISFDCGFHSPENQRELAKIVENLSLPMPGKIQAAQQQAQESVQFHQSRRRHSGIESAIGALQSGNGLKRCRDKTELGFERYLALAILGRNLHTLGKRLLALKYSATLAAQSKRKAA